MVGAVVRVGLAGGRMVQVDFEGLGELGSLSEAVSGAAAMLIEVTLVGPVARLVELVD